MPDSQMHAQLVRELKVVRRAGLHRLRDHLDELPTLCGLAERTLGAATAERVETVLREAWRQKAEGAQGTAIGLLLGLEQGRRGANPRVLREVAAKRLGYHSVDTFRKKPEEYAFTAFADTIESWVIDFENAPLRQDDRIETAIRAIENLNAREYGLLIQRLRERYQWFNTEPGSTEFTK